MIDQSVLSDHKPWCQICNPCRWIIVQYFGALGWKITSEKERTTPGGEWFEVFSMDFVKGDGGDYTWTISQYLYHIIEYQLSFIPSRYILKNNLLINKRKIFQVTWINWWSKYQAEYVDKTADNCVWNTSEVYGRVAKKK